MPLIILHTLIAAPPNICFDCARNIDLHKRSMKDTGEQAIAGVQKGLIGLNETVTWKATHFGIPFRLTSLITAMSPPDSFTDEMVRGPFRVLIHKHAFVFTGKVTVMTDEFYYESPLGLLGRLADILYLKKYMKQLLERRNACIRDAAEIMNSKR